MFPDSSYHHGPKTRQREGDGGGDPPPSLRKNLAYFSIPENDIRSKPNLLWWKILSRYIKKIDDYNQRQRHSDVIRFKLKWWNDKDFDPFLSKINRKSGFVLIFEFEILWLFSGSSWPNFKFSLTKNRKMKVRYNSVLMQLTVRTIRLGCIHNFTFPKFTEFDQFFPTFTDFFLDFKISWQFHLTCAFEVIILLELKNFSIFLPYKLYISLKSNWSSFYCGWGRKCSAAFYSWKDKDPIRNCNLIDLKPII